MVIRKFYDAGVKEASANPKYKIGEEINFHELGTTPDEEVATEEKEESEELKVEETKTETKVEDKKEEPTEEKKEEEKVEEKEFIAPQTPDWKELISKQDPKEVYKHLNIDESVLELAKELASDTYAKKLFTYRKENGNITPFIEAASKDWDKVNDQQLILDDLKKQYSHLSPEKAEKLAKSDFNQRFIYKEDPNLEEAENQELAELTALKLESEAGRVRNLRKQEQQQFLDSVKPIDRKAEAERIAKERQSAAEKELQEFKSLVERDPFYSKLNSEKKIVIGDKEKIFNYTVNPEAIKEQTLDSNKFYSQFWTQKEGQEHPVFNFELWSKVSAFSQNPNAYDEALINHGISLGQKKIVEEELENKPPKTDPQSQVKKKTIAKSVEEGKEFSFG